MIARIVYKNKSGWKTGKHTFVKGTEEQLEKYARKEAHGREYRVQKLDEVPAHYEKIIFTI